MRLGVRQLVVLSAAAAAALPPRAADAQASLSRDGHVPVAVRAALTVGEARTTVWTQVHATTDAGPFALVVPAAPGAAVDLATDAWLEAIEAATAVRIGPPSGIDATCPGASDEPLHVAGDLEHHATLLPAEIDVVVGAAELLLWAAERQLEVPGPVAQALADGETTHFVALRFAAPAADVWTPTIRVALPGSKPVLPLAIAHADATPIAVTLFTFGAGRPLLPGVEVAVDPAAIELDAATSSSSYPAARASVLAPHGAWLVEAAGHAPLVSSLALPGGATAPSLVDEYLARAAAYGVTSEDPDACAAIAIDAIEQPGAIGLACARGDVAVVEGGSPCVEAPAVDEIDPARLRCGTDADDLALALSGLSGSEAWLGRVAMAIAPGESGADQVVGVSDGAAVEPSLEAGGVDLSGCDGGGGAGGGGEGGGTGASSTGSGSGSGPGGATPPTTGPSAGSGASVVVEVPVRVYDVTCGCSGEYVIVDYVEVAESDVPEDGSYYAEESDDCGGDSSGSYETGEVEESPPEDDCGGDSSDSASDEGCSGETSDTAESGSSSDDSCSGDTTDTSGDDGDDSTDGDDGGGDDGGDDGGDSTDGGDDGSESGGDSGCGCDESAVAAAAGRARMRTGTRRLLAARPRLSVMTIGLIALLAPLRRLTRPRRRDSR